MKTLNTQWKKAIVLGALTVAPTLAATTQAQAAPFRSGPTWNNARIDARNNNQRPSGRISDRFDNNNRGYDNRNNDHRADNRFDPRRNDHNTRNDVRRDDYNNKGTSTGKLLGAGLIGAIIGAVISR